MPLPQLNTEISFSKGELADLGTVLKNIFKTNPVSAIYSSENPQLTPHFLKNIDEENLQLLLNLNLAQYASNHYTWCFLPVLGNNLIFFRDFPKYISHSQYVWVRENTASGSWKFAQSLPVKKRTRVLDLGTGSGLLALTARLKGGTVLGIDINPRAIMLASLNLNLNNLDDVEFQLCNWVDVDSDQFDLIVSQPPFDSYLTGMTPSFAFNGGNRTGLRATEEIIRLFCPKKGQTLILYIHVFENDSQSHFQGLLDEWIDTTSVHLELKPQKCYSIESWWKSIKLRRSLDPNLSLPPDFHLYKKKVAYFVILSGN
ncbi:MAG: methyltransferase [Candidatus Hodarchaeota archaeon]